MAQLRRPPLDLIETGTIDALAHLDLFKVAGRRPPEIELHEARLAKAIADADIAVEVSTAGLRKPARELYPSPSLLRQLITAGVPLTTASDAHHLELIGDGFEALRQELAEHGVTTLTDFDQRQRIPHPL